MTTRASTIDTIRDLVNTQVQCTLATVNAGRPSQHLMAYAFEPSLGSILLVSGRRTTKTHNMLADPAVSLLWDNRTGNTKDHCRGLALAAEGNAQVLQGWMRVRAARLLRLRSPELANLLHQADALVFSIKVGTYRLAEGYGTVTRWTPCAAGATSGQYEDAAVNTFDNAAGTPNTEAA